MAAQGAGGARPAPSRDQRDIIPLVPPPGTSRSSPGAASGPPAATGRNPSRRRSRRGVQRRPGRSEQGGGVDQEAVVRLRPAAAGATGVNRNQRSAARAAPWVAETRGERRSSVGSDRPSDRIGQLGPY
jgi:hypothetical protein